MEELGERVAHPDSAGSPSSASPAAAKKGIGASPSVNSDPRHYGHAPLGARHTAERVQRLTRTRGPGG